MFNSLDPNIKLFASHIYNTPSVLPMRNIVENYQCTLLLVSAFRDKLFSTFHEIGSYKTSEQLVEDVKSDSTYKELFEVLFFAKEKFDLGHLNETLTSFNNLDKDFLDNNFPKIFETLLSYINSFQDKYSVDSLQPKELTNFILSLVNLKTNATVYNPFAGLASFALTLNEDKKYYGQEIVANTWAIGQLRIKAHRNIFNSNYKCADSILDWNTDEKFDLIVANVPFKVAIRKDLKSSLTGDKLGYIESFIIDKGINSIKDDGQLITVLPLYILNSPGNEAKLRKKLIEEKLIESIIQMPSGLLSFTNIPFCIIIFKKNPIKTNCVKFVDASRFFVDDLNTGKYFHFEQLSEVLQTDEENEFVRCVDTKIIADNNFDLSIGRYFLGDIEGVKLSSLFEIEKGATAPEMETYPIVRVKDILNSTPYLDYSSLLESPSKRAPRFTSGQYLLVNAIGSKISSAISKELQTIFFNQSLIQVLKLIEPDKVDLEYVHYIFQSEDVQKQIKGVTGGASQSIRLRAKDLLNIKIPLPSLEEQKLYVINQLRGVIQKEEASLAKLKIDSGIDDADDISYLRHSLAGSVKNVRDSFAKVLSILEGQVFNQNPELRLLTSTSRSKITLQKHLEIICTDLESVKNTLNRTSIEIDVRTMNKTVIDFIDFIKGYSNVLKANRGNEFEVKFEYDLTLLENSDIKTIYVNGNKEMLRTALDNVVENAVKHAFTGEKNPLIEFELLFDFESDNMLQLDIANNGKCIPENFTIDDLTRKGQRVGKNAGDGFGGYLIKEIIEAHGGSVDITDESGVEGFNYPRISTSFEITLPFTINPEEYV